MIIKSLEKIAYELKLRDENKVKSFLNNANLRHKEIKNEFPPMEMLGCRHTYYNLTTRNFSFSNKLKYELNIHYGYRKDILNDDFNIYNDEIIDNLIDIRNELLIVSLDTLEGESLSLKVREQIIQVLIEEIKKEDLVKYIVVKSKKQYEREFYKSLGFNEMIINDYYLLKNSSCSINYEMILKL